MRRDPRRGRRPRIRCSRSAASSAARSITGAGAARRLAGRGARQRPVLLRRRLDRGRLAEGRRASSTSPTRSICRSCISSTIPGFVIGIEAEKAGHDPPRRARARGGLPGERAVVLGDHAQGVRRRRRGAHATHARLHYRYRLAVGRLGLAAARRRDRGGLSRRARGGAATARSCAARSRSGSTGALAVPHRRGVPASRRSSTRATRGRCCASSPIWRPSCARRVQSRPQCGREVIPACQAHRLRNILVAESGFP